MTTTVETSTVDSGSMLRTEPLTGQELADYIAASPINPAGLPTAYEHGNRLTAPGSRVDPIIVEIVEGTLASVEMEVETSISRTSRSPMIRDAHDFRASMTVSFASSPAVRTPRSFTQLSGTSPSKRCARVMSSFTTTSTNPRAASATYRTCA